MATRKTKATSTKKRTATKKKAAPKKTQTETRDDLPGLQKGYPHVQSITKTNEKGKALRVLISCQADYGLPRCDITRDIATQDAFQVRRCVVCQAEFAKRRRRKTPVAA